MAMCAPHENIITTEWGIINEREFHRLFVHACAFFLSLARSFVRTQTRFSLFILSQHIIVVDFDDGDGDEADKEEKEIPYEDFFFACSLLPAALLIIISHLQIESKKRKIFIEWQFFFHCAKNLLPAIFIYFFKSMWGSGKFMGLWSSSGDWWLKVFLLNFKKCRLGVENCYFKNCLKILIFYKKFQ